MSLAALARRLADAGTPMDAIIMALEAVENPKDERPRRKGSKWRARQFSALCERDGPTCQDCGCSHRVIWREAGVCVTSFEEGYRFTRVNPSSVLEVDHRIPLSEGGSNELDNLWLLCRDCHKAKTSAERSARLKGMFAEWRAQQVAT